MSIRDEMGVVRRDSARAWLFHKQTERFRESVMDIVDSDWDGQKPATDGEGKKQTSGWGAITQTLSRAPEMIDSPNLFFSLSRAIWIKKGKYYEYSRFTVWINTLSVLWFSMENWSNFE